MPGPNAAGKTLGLYGAVPAPRMPSQRAQVRIAAGFNARKNPSNVVASWDSALASYPPGRSPMVD